ncbi:CHAT domain-containing protein [Streptomyces sp. SBT349]|uniref:CHAT domain-containing protein n=1 Tax=Streptomyces sp. SBT349 TaxID=1580539 RepID=UPI00066DAA67|nr:CHAT domain-containing protein [Streptomyces sp. SBT349]
MNRSDMLRRELTRLERRATDISAALTRARRLAQPTDDDARRVTALGRRLADLNASMAGVRTSLDEALAVERTVPAQAFTPRRESEEAHARALAHLSHLPEVRDVPVAPPREEGLRVLYCTANPRPELTRIQHPDGRVETRGGALRTEVEVRKVRQAVEARGGGAAIALHHLPAATLPDLVDGLAAHAPHILHFSGHGSARGLLLEDDEGSLEGAEVDFTLLARVLGAPDTPPGLVVLNACESLAGADDLLRTVPAVVGMPEAVTQKRAEVFAIRFYTAIAEGTSVARAVERASEAMRAVGKGETPVPELRTRQGVDPEELVLVRPRA